MSTKFVYVVLHYNAIDDTVACVESIFHYMVEQPFEVVIVDNASPNGTGATLEALYRENTRVHVLRNKRNIGFARGNNVGYLFAKNMLHADYIVMLNNDTLLLDDALQRLAEQEYECSRCGVIGPKILTPTPPFDSNPGAKSLPSLRRALWSQVYMGAYLLLSYFNLDEAAVRRFDKSQQRRVAQAACSDRDHREEDVVLHGCFWIFTPTYVQRYDGIDNRTFMYGEEDLLFLRCRRAGIGMVFLPAITIFHKEDAATNTLTFSRPVNRRRFAYCNAIRSKWVLIIAMIWR